MKRSRALRIAALLTACLYLFSPFGTLLAALSATLLADKLPSYILGLVPGLLIFIVVYCAIMARSFAHRVYHGQTGRLF